MSTAITVTRQKMIVFNGDELVAISAEDDMIYVPLKPICERLGIAWQPQARKINSDPVLSSVSMSITIRLQTSEGSKRPKSSKMLALPLGHLNGWLFGINANRVREEIRPKLLSYQRDVYRVLYEAFVEKKPATAPDTTIDDIIAADPHLSEAVSIAQAIITMARSQAALRADVVNLDKRVQLLEADSGKSDRYIKNSQAMQIAQAVKQLALELGKRSGRSEFGAVWGEVHRRFKIPRYEQLPAVQFEECMGFLRQWYESLTDEADVIF